MGDISKQTFLVLLYPPREMAYPCGFVVYQGIQLWPINKSNRPVNKSIVQYARRLYMLGTNVDRAKGRLGVCAFQSLTCRSG